MECKEFKCKKKVCDILGQCIFTHEIIKGSQEATQKIRATNNIIEINAILKKYSIKRLNLPKK